MDSTDGLYLTGGTYFVDPGPAEHHDPSLHELTTSLNEVVTPSSRASATRVCDRCIVSVNGLPENRRTTFADILKEKDQMCGTISCTVIVRFNGLREQGDMQRPCSRCREAGSKCNYSIRRKKPGPATKSRRKASNSAVGLRVKAGWLSWSCITLAYC